MPPAIETHNDTCYEYHGSQLLVRDQTVQGLAVDHTPPTHVLLPRVTKKQCDLLEAVGLEQHYVQLLMTRVSCLQEEVVRQTIRDAIKGGKNVFESRRD